MEARWTGALDWSPELVVTAVRHPLSMRLYAEAPYIPELYQADLESRVVHPSRVRGDAFAPPCVLRRRSKVWFVPGSADDLLLHTSCVVACCSAIVRLLTPDADEVDSGPPLVRELSKGTWGLTTMAAYWSRLDRQVERWLATEFTHVVYADIERCIESLHAGRISRLLTAAGADPDAVRVMDDMQRVWQRHGHRGLPLTMGFKVLLKLYLKSVDDALHRQGLTFARLQDDFRIVCHGEAEATSALEGLRNALTACGLVLNESKTRTFSRAQARWSPSRWRLESARRLSQGIVQPALADALEVRPLRPAALRLLKLLYGRRCGVAPS